MAAVGARRRRELSRIPDQVRHTEKWRLALEMIEEMTGPGGWGVLEQVTAAGGARPVVVSGIGYGDNALFREVPAILEIPQVRSLNFPSWLRAQRVVAEVSVWGSWRHPLRVGR